MRCAKKELISIAAIVIGVAATLPVFGQKDDKEQKPQSPGEKVYMANCEACHLLGQNMIKPEKPIIASTKLISRNAFKEFLTEKHTIMPRFEAIANNEKDLKDLYAFVKKLKHQSWEYDQKEFRPAESPMKEPQPPQQAE
jgi:mono/diheme cytochrome c family protein